MFEFSFGSLRTALFGNSFEFGSSNVDPRQESSSLVMCDGSFGNSTKREIEFPFEFPAYTFISTFTSRTNEQ